MREKVEATTSLTAQQDSPHPDFDLPPIDERIYDDVGYYDDENQYHNFGGFPIENENINTAENTTTSNNAVNGHIAVEQDNGAINNPIDIALAPKDSQQIETQTAMKF